MKTRVIPCEWPAQEVVEHAIHCHFHPGIASPVLHKLRERPEVQTAFLENGVLRLVLRDNVVLIHGEGLPVNERHGLLDRIRVCEDGVSAVAKLYRRDQRDLGLPTPAKQANLVLGVVRNSHDSAAVLVKDGRIMAAMEEERFDRNRHTSCYFPEESVRRLLARERLDWTDISHIAVNFNYNFYVSTPGSAAPVVETYDREDWDWPFLLAGQQRYNPQTFEKWLVDFSRRLGSNYLPAVTYVPHHKAHAVSAWMTSPFVDEPTLVLVIDGKGEDDSTTVWLGHDRRLERIGGSLHPHSLGHLYNIVTQYAGFRRYDEGKLMGLAPYGAPRGECERKRVDALHELFGSLVHVNKRSGDMSLEAGCLQFGLLGDPGSARMSFSDKTLHQLADWAPPPDAGRGGSRLDPDDADDRPLVNLAYAFQGIIEDTLATLVEFYLNCHPATRAASSVVLAGGLALNVAANGQLIRRGLVGCEHLYVPGFAADDGTPVGAALSVAQEEYGLDVFHPLKTLALGSEYSDKQIQETLDAFGLRKGEDYRRCACQQELIDEAAVRLADYQTLAWFQGRSELGPRALGQRSILHAATDREGGARVNLIKGRERWRPSAMSVTAEAAPGLFEHISDSRFMTVSYPVREGVKAMLRSGVHPCPTDMTTRPQTVDRSVQPLFWELLKAVGIRTGVPGLLNTSFNRREPIVETPEEALNTFYYATGLSALVIGSYLVERTPRLAPTILAAEDEHATRDALQKALHEDAWTQFWQTLRGLITSRTRWVRIRAGRSVESTWFPLFREFFRKDCRGPIIASLMHPMAANAAPDATLRVETSAPEHYSRVIVSLLNRYGRCPQQFKPAG